MVFDLRIDLRINRLVVRISYYNIHVLTSISVYIQYIQMKRICQLFFVKYEF
jgi:hypothetical protein